MTNDVESYVVRIYRRRRHRPQDFVGIVEAEGEAEPRGFRSAEELWNILARPTPRRGSKGRPAEG
jgi:hypothetical protein